MPELMCENPDIIAQWSFRYVAPGGSVFEGIFVLTSDGTLTGYEHGIILRRVRNVTIEQVEEAAARRPNWTLEREELS